MSRCFHSYVQPSSTPVSKFISNHPSPYLLENKCSNMKHLQMLRRFSGSPNPEIAIDIFVQMLVVSLSIQAGRLTYPSVFKDYTQLGLANDGAQLHGRVVKSSLEFDQFIRNTMIGMYANRGSEARKLFGENEVADVVAWNSMITGALEQGKWIHTYMKKHNVKLNVIVITALINMYCRCGDIKTAFRVFENTTLGYNGLSCWNMMIMGLATNGFQNEAIELFSRLQSSLQLDSVSSIGVLTSCNHSGLVNKAKNYFIIMKTVYNIETLSQYYGCMIDTLGRAGHLEEAKQFTKQMPMNPDASIWDSLLSAARYHKNVKVARRAAEKLAQLQTYESGSYTLMSNAYAASGHFMKAVEE